MRIPVVALANQVIAREEIVTLEVIRRREQALDRGPDGNSVTLAPLAVICVCPSECGLRWEPRRLPFSDSA